MSTRAVKSPEILVISYITISVASLECSRNNSRSRTCLNV